MRFFISLLCFISTVSMADTAPGLKIKKVSDNSYLLAFGKGDDVLGGLENFATKNDLKFASFHGIGALRSVNFGWFDPKKKTYLPHHIDTPVEVTSLNGNIMRYENKPIVHAHINVADSAGNTHGGHLLNGTVFPTLEVFVTTSDVKIDKLFDEETDLKLVK